MRFWTRRGGPFFVVGGMATWSVTLWDSGEVRDEISHAGDAGFSFLRVSVPWDVLQPEPAQLRTALVDRLIILLDSCEAAGVTMNLDVSGTLGGRFFAPRWALATEPAPGLLRSAFPVMSEGWESPLPLKNLYEHEPMLEAQSWLWGELSRHLASHPAFGLLDPGFGGLLTAVPARHAELALRWWERVRETPHAGAAVWQYTDSAALMTQPGAPALDAWLEAVGAFALGLPIQGAAANGEVDDGLAPFQMLLAQSLARGAVGCASAGIATSDSARRNAPPPTLGEGEGALLLATEEEQARAFAELLPALRSLGVPTVCHTVWADSPPHLYGSLPYVTHAPLRHAGLLRADGREKEALARWREFNAAAAGAALTEARRFDIDPDAWRERRGEPGHIEQLRREMLP